MPNVLSPRDLLFRPDNMDETVPHTHTKCSVDVNFQNLEFYQFLPDLIIIIVVHYL